MLPPAKATKRSGTALWIPPTLTHEADEIARQFGKTRTEVVCQTLKYFLPKVKELFEAEKSAVEMVVNQ